MGRKIKVKINNVEYDGSEEEFQIVREDWNEYKLLDGGTVRVKTIVQKIVRVLDSEGKPTYTPEGDPNVLVRHNTQVTTTE